MKKISFLFFLLFPLLLAAQENNPVRGDLKPVHPDAARKGISWSPRGAKAKFSPLCPEKLRSSSLTEVSSLIEPVFGIINAGDSTLNEIYFALSRKSAGSPYRERLTIDTNGDGKFDPQKETLDSEAKDVRGKMWVSHNDVSINVKFGDGNIVHRINIWHVYPKPGEEGEFDVIRYSRSSWMEGAVAVDGKKYRIALIDADNNLSFTSDDVWTITEENENTEKEITKSFGVPLIKPSFIGEQAFRLINYSQSGGRIDIIKSSDKKEIPAEKKPEILREKSTKQLPWIHKLEEAFAAGKSAGKKIFVKWWAEWCGPCKELEKTTLADKIIVDMLGKDWITASINSDNEYLDAQKQSVKALPTIQFFTPDGKEIKRYVGFLNAEELEKMLKELK